MKRRSPNKALSLFLLEETNGIADERAIYTVRYAIATMPVVQRGYNFEQASYMKWAGREVLIRLCKHPEIPPLIVIESFRDECDSYSCVNPRTSYVFSCAKDMLEWIIDLLIS